MITLNRWKTFEKRDQLLHIGAELERARTAQGGGFQSHFRLALERAAELIELTFHDPKWNNDTEMLRCLQGEVAKFYRGEATGDVGILYRAL